MNELTITGNLTDEPTLHYTPGGAAILTLTVAVNDRRFDRGRGQWVDRPAVFHRVVAFRGLAENAANLARGSAVTVTGKLADDSWTPQDSGRKVYRTVLEAGEHRREPALRHRRGHQGPPRTARRRPRRRRRDQHGKPGRVSVRSSSGGAAPGQPGVAPHPGDPDPSRRPAIQAILAGLDGRTCGQSAGVE